MSVAVMVLYLWITIAFRGLVLMALWKWFLVPAFALPLLTEMTAIGISIIATLLTYRPNFSDHGRRTSLQEFYEFAAELFFPALFLFSGWVLHGIFR